ncbi:MAG: tetratricopeptide repeat protein [Desulfosarcinaceae bacterium]
MADKKMPCTLAEWFEYGRSCFHLPDGVEAVRAFRKVADMNPGYRHPDGDNPYFYLGKIFEVEGRLEEAIVHYSRALAIDPEDEESLIGRGSCFTVIKEHARAIDDFSHLLHMSQGRRKIPDKHLLYVIAENYRQMKEWGQAIYWAQLALNADPGNERHQKLYEMIVAGMHPESGKPQ